MLLHSQLEHQITGFTLDVRLAFADEPLLVAVVRTDFHFDLKIASRDNICQLLVNHY